MDINLTAKREAGAHFPQAVGKAEGVTCCIKDTVKLHLFKLFPKEYFPKDYSSAEGCIMYCYPFLVKVMLLQRAAHPILARANVPVHFV